MADYTLVPGDGFYFTVDSAQNQLIINRIADSASGSAPEVYSITSSSSAPDIFTNEDIDYTITTDAPGATFLLVDSDGTSASVDFDTGVISGLNGSTPGSYTLTVKAGNVVGVTPDFDISLLVNLFTQSGSNTFGTASDLQAIINVSSSRTGGWKFHEGIIYNDGGTLKIDRTGAYDAVATNKWMIYNSSRETLLGFVVDGGGLNDVKYWTGVTDISHDTALNSGFSYAMEVSQKTTAYTTSLRGKACPILGYYNGGLTGSHYLSITPDSSEYNGFGSKGTDWSYCFVLEDDWMCGSHAPQLLSPTGSNYFIGTINGFEITSATQRFNYGDNVSGPFSGSTGIVFNAATRNYIMATAGQLVTVAFNATTDTMYFYVDSDLLGSSTSIDTYMDETTTPSELRFGDHAGSALSSEDFDYDTVGGMPYQMKYLAIATGTYFDATAVSDLVANKADLTLATNYSNIKDFFEFTDSDVSVTKGNATLDRGTVTF